MLGCVCLFAAFWRDNSAYCLVLLLLLSYFWCLVGGFLLVLFTLWLKVFFILVGYLHILLMIILLLYLTPLKKLLLMTLHFFSRQLHVIDIFILFPLVLLIPTITTTIMMNLTSIELIKFNFRFTINKHLLWRYWYDFSNFWCDLFLLRWT